MLFLRRDNYYIRLLNYLLHWFLQIVNLSCGLPEMYDLIVHHTLLHFQPCFAATYFFFVSLTHLLPELPPEFNILFVCGDTFEYLCYLICPIDLFYLEHL